MEHRRVMNGVGLYIDKSMNMDTFCPTFKEEPRDMDVDDFSTSRRLELLPPLSVDVDSVYNFDLPSNENGSGPLSDNLSGPFSDNVSGPLSDSISGCSPLSQKSPEGMGQMNGSLGSEGTECGEEDIFQVDKADLIQGPTLAELNASNESIGLMGDFKFDFDDLLLPDFASEVIAMAKSEPPMGGQPIRNCMDPCMSTFASSFPPPAFASHQPSMSSSAPTRPNFTNQQFSSSMQTSPTHTGTKPKRPNQLQPQLANQEPIITAPSHSSTSTFTSRLVQKHSTLHQLLQKAPASSPVSITKSRPEAHPSVPSPDLAASSLITRDRLSTSAPVESKFYHWKQDQKFQALAPRSGSSFLGDSIAIGSSASSISTGGVLSPASVELSHDEGFNSDSDDDTSDEEYGDEGSERQLSSSFSKKERFFWQYNVQAKGPKGQRLVLTPSELDPHRLEEIVDPVFNPAVALHGIRHSGKARRGDGNDLTPNPKKLFSIGRELDHLNAVINDMTPVSELPFTVRPQTRKEKNKLASRVCRLKKKAQHEANKMKLHGLEHEHKHLMDTLWEVKKLVRVRMGLPPPCVGSPMSPCHFPQAKVPALDDGSLEAQVDKLMKHTCKHRIAGHTTEYVNKVLEKVKSNSSLGSLEEV